MPKTSNTQFRDRDFCRCCIRVYDELLQAGRTPRLQEVVQRAIACRPEAFYIDPVYAYNKLCSMRHTPVAGHATPAACMWQQLDAMVAARQMRTGCSMLQALGHVLNHERPTSFAITVARGMRLARTHFVRHTSHRPRRSLL